MSARIRPAGASDIAALVSMEERAFAGDRIPARSFRRLLGSGTADVLAAFSVDDTAIGYAMILYRSNTDVARLYSIAVDGVKGVGRTLLQAAEEAAARRGARALRLEVREDNVRAIDLYQRNGYVQIGRRADYYADGAPALRFEKTLPASATGGSAAIPVR